MTSDWEKRDEERRRKNEQEKAELSALTADLNRILEDPNADMDTLERQVDLLDCLLYTTMRVHLRRAREKGQPLTEEQINLALRIQKQCADTTRINGALNYMNAISPIPFRVVPLPRLSPQDDGGVPPPPK